VGCTFRSEYPVWNVNHDKKMNKTWVPAGFYGKGDRLQMHRSRINHWFATDNKPIGWFKITPKEYVF
jgi:hypothetical protein